MGTGEKYFLVSGFYTFQNSNDAILFKEKLMLSLNENNIVYGEILSLENSHHWQNPSPDIVLDRIILGNERNVPVLLN